ncbi:MAG TPA: glycogen synthase GlgA [Methylophilus sp.]|nr:glycogen synthase GlgA [Methylophilus sp.]HQQ33520.1 glycogen synthase GlgA [Methylophilus sp.]
MNILFVTSEAFPLIKTGGLADVSGALPKVVRTLPQYSGSIRLLIPGYNPVLAKLKNAHEIAKVTVLGQQCSLVLGTMPDSDLAVIAVQNTFLYERNGGPYNDAQGHDWLDNPLRFAILSRVASILASTNSPLPDWKPDLVHCNDWQTGLTPAYMKLVDHSPAKSILSIHNLAFQGNCHPGWLHTLGLPEESFQINGLEYYGQISFLKAGVFYADKLSTVSPTYAKEIQTEAFGFGMQGLLKSRADDLIGILNGIDANEWSPEKDIHISKHFSKSNLAGKKVIKANLQEHLGLHIDANAPILGVVSRLTYQKGLDLLPSIMPELVQAGCQFAILGSGEKGLESAFNDMAQRFPSRVSVTNGYHEHLSHNIMAGTDMFIMPSRFEPCGLNQLYGLAYGTPPIVTRTGGLADSVCDTNELSLKHHTATGFVLENVSEMSLLVTIQRALSVWKDQPTWKKIQINGMKQDLSWETRAISYLSLYNNTLEQ